MSWSVIYGYCQKNVKKQEKVMTIEDMIDSLKKGVVNITFKKIDSGEIRKMPSTLKSELIPDGTKIQSISSTSDTIMVWSLDKNAWRDIRVNTISSWETV
tara:strand:- start:767 stop:1066 length:300 start_codon:yes stop_codon:yes gene_type:complete